MQYRQSDRKLYFHELSTTSQKYFIPYIEKYKEITHGINVLEIGCGDGGNLLPFSKRDATLLGLIWQNAELVMLKSSFMKPMLQENFLLQIYLILKGRMGFLI